MSSIVSSGRINLVNPTGGAGASNAVVAFFAPQKLPPHWFSEFYRGGAHVGANVSSNVPTTGILWLSNFYGTTIAIVAQGEDTTPRQYPPASLGGTTTNPASVSLSGQTHGNGVYTMSASSSYGNGLHPPCGAFDFDTSTWPAGAWVNQSATGYTYNGSTGVYGGSSTTTVSGVAHLGEWVQIKLPQNIVLTSYTLIEVAERMATSYILAGSLDGTTWVALSVQSPTQSALTGNNTATVTLPNNILSYPYYRLIIKSISTRNQYGFCGVFEIQLYGYASERSVILLGDGVRIDGGVSGRRGSGSSLAWHMATVVNGTVYAWGLNTYGMVGDGTTTPRLTPVAITGGSLSSKKVIAVTRGTYHTLAVDSTGGVHAWGSGANGRLGIGNTNNSYTPVAVTGGSLSGKVVTAVAAGGHFSLALDSTGVLHGWGADWAGQLGDLAATDRTTPYAITGGNMGSRTIVSMTAGDSYTVAVTSTGSFIVFGQNDNGQLGTGGANNTSPLELTISGKSVVAVAAGFAHTFAITSDGLLYATGNNANGRLGDGTNTQRLSYVPISGGSLAGKTVVGVAVGDPMSYALDSLGGVHAWGANSGRLGNGGTADEYSPVAISGGSLAGKTVRYIASSRDEGFAIDTTGQIHGWGLNSYGQLGIGNSNVYSSPSLVTSFSNSNVANGGEGGGGGGGTVLSVTYYPNVGDTEPNFITRYGTTDYTGQTGWNQRINGSYHSLHPMSYSATSGIYYNNLSLGSAFTMTFDWYYGKPSCCFAADGLKILFYTDSTMVDPTTGIGTTGWGGRTYGGYSMLIERYNYLSQRYVQIMYNNTEVYKSGTFTEPGFDVFRTFSVSYNLGVITVVLNGTTIGSYTHGVTPTYTNSYLAIIGVSGGDQSEQRIRNLLITRN